MEPLFIPRLEPEFFLEKVKPGILESLISAQVECSHVLRKRKHYEEVHAENFS
jgi:hypothetical protein